MIADLLKDTINKYLIIDKLLVSMEPEVLNIIDIKYDINIGDQKYP